MSVSERVYRGLVRAGRRVAPALSLGGSKLARGIRGRRGAAERLEAWALAERDPERPLVWVHAPSVGEGLQARAVIEALRERRPDTQIAFTHFSPSAEALAARMPVEVAGYLPWDVPAEVERAVRALRPDWLAFTKTELWPVLAGAARAAGARTALVGATLPEESSRLRWPARAVVGPTLAALDLVAAIAPADAERLIGMGAPAAAVHVTGDPGIDSAAGRAGAADPRAPHLRPFADPTAAAGAAGRPTLVAGSTWSGDEAVLVPALLEARRSQPALRVVLAPHEPEEAGMRALEERMRAAGWRTARLGAVEAAGSAGAADLVVVDRVGVLAELYTIGDLAWVGGGFHRAGLHSVLEPAAAGLPMAFGPAHGNARAAADLLAAGAAVEVADVRAAASALGRWLADAEARASAGAAARRYIRGHLGAAARTAARLAEALR